jgi:two-component system OmpR family response regulator
MQILVVDDDTDSVNRIRQGCLGTHHVVEYAENGRDGWVLAASERFDVVVINRFLPGGISGPQLLASLRAQNNLLPVLMVSEVTELADRVEILRAGCDDYLLKPFDVGELIARAEALGRRRKGAGRETKLVVHDLEIDLLSKRAVRAGRPLDLRPREYLLLEYMMRHAGTVVTRTMLMDAVWGFDNPPPANLVAVHVSSLRRKVDKPFAASLIRTVWAAGYMLAEPDGTPAMPRRQPAMATQG